MQVTPVVFVIGVKALLDGRIGREAARDRIRDSELVLNDSRVTPLAFDIGAGPTS
jgi:hypothetical protein